MSISCTKCPKVFKSARDLSCHEQKSLPCNLECSGCHYIAKDRFQYYRHVKTCARKELQAEEPEVVPMPYPGR